MTIHTIYALASFGKDEFINPVLADFAFKAMSMVCIVTGHDSFVKNWLFTDVTSVGTVGADWRAIGEQ